MDDTTIRDEGDRGDVFHSIVRRLASRALGVEPTGLAPTASPDAVLLEVAGRRLVAKAPAPGRPGSALVEAWAYEACRRRGVRTPEVVAVSDEPECIIVEALPGRTLWSEERRRGDDRAVWHGAGEDLRAIHEIRLAGFGPLVATGVGEPRGEADAWCPFVRYAREEGIGYLARTGYIGSAAARCLERRYDDAAPELNRCDDGRLLHGDLEGGHVFGTAAGTYGGLIDFGLAQAGDPRWDLARVVLWDGPDALDALLDGYGRHTVTRDDRDTVFPLYLLAFVIHQAVRLDRSGRRDAAREHLQQVGYGGTDAG